MLFETSITSYITWFRQILRLLNQDIDRPTQLKLTKLTVEEFMENLI